MAYKDPNGQRDYYWRNRRLVLAKQKVFRESNPDHCREKKKEEYLRNRSSYLDYAIKKWHRLEYWEKKFKNAMAKAYCKASEIVGVESIRQFFREVYTNESGVCTYCKVELPVERIVIDHKTPYKLGGKHEVSNLVVCCAKCNSKKKAKPFDEWIGIVRNSYGNS